ncbi:unnamed protein product [Clonostachys rhizophaga]|uniref:Alpha/beta hydrolase fold-3 domain-containing protein n=1 Tax=Clonostachys rhizophaga TaxID=160324 RepID=A0A9N9YUH3_9HYPO|nr:unnamed protein product [Clonostachys rhizophaga]
MTTPGYLDTLNAYKGVRSSLTGLLGLPISSVLVSGSSAGGYLALTTASLAGEKPDALLLIYGMLDSANSRYTTLGPNIFGQPAIETEPVLREFPKPRGKDETRERISAYAMPPVVARDRQYALVSALHIEGLFVDYLTSVDGLARAIADRRVETIPEEHRRLFPLSFDRLANQHASHTVAARIKWLDHPSQVQSESCAERLGAEASVEFPDDAEPGFDVRAGNVNVEGAKGDSVITVESLRSAIRFLQAAE